MNTAQGADTYEVMAANDPGRRARFEALFAAHYRDVHRYALRRTEPALAEEVANEAFLVALAAVREGAARAPAAVAVRRRRACARQPAPRGDPARAAVARPRPRSDRPPAVTPPTGSPSATPSCRRSPTLAERDREALRLTAWERLSLADGARAAGVTRPAFAMRVSRARRRLAAALRERDASIDLDHFLEPVDA